MPGYSITAEELLAQTVAALKAKGIELGHPLSDEDAASIGQFMAESEKKGGVELPTSQAETDGKLGQIKEMPKEGFEMMVEMVTMKNSPEAEELMAQTIAVVKAKGIELGQQPLSDEDALNFVAAMSGLPKGKIMPPKGAGKGGFDGDEWLGQLREIPKEAFEMFTMMAAKGAGKGGKGKMAGKAFSITAEELVDQTVAAFKARAAELGQTLSDEDAALMASSMGQASVDLPESQAEVDGKLGQIKEMPKEAFEQTIEMIKMMAAKGAGKGE